METVGEYEAKTNLPKLLERVRRGEQITITKHGVPVAVLQPAVIQKKRDVEAVIQQIRKFRDIHSLNGITIQEMIEEGRR